MRSNWLPKDGCLRCIDTQGKFNRARILDDFIIDLQVYNVVFDSNVSDPHPIMHLIDSISPAKSSAFLNICFKSEADCETTAPESGVTAIKKPSALPLHRRKTAPAQIPFSIHQTTRNLSNVDARGISVRRRRYGD